jgi:hypothetical protein
MAAWMAAESSVTPSPFAPAALMLITVGSVNWTEAILTASVSANQSTSTAAPLGSEAILAAPREDVAGPVMVSVACPEANGLKQQRASRRGATAAILANPHRHPIGLDRRCIIFPLCRLVNSPYTPRGLERHYHGTILSTAVPRCDSSIEKAIGPDRKCLSETVGFLGGKGPPFSGKLGSANTS